MTFSRWDWAPSLATDAALFFAYTVASTVGLSLLKVGLVDFRLAQWVDSLSSRSGLILAIGTLCYVGSFGLWLVLLARHPVSVAYPIAIGLSVVGIAVADLMWFARVPSAAELGGLALILLGVVIVFAAGAGSDGYAG